MPMIVLIMHVQAQKRSRFWSAAKFYCLSTPTTSIFFFFSNFLLPLYIILMLQWGSVNWPWVISQFAAEIITSLHKTSSKIPGVMQIHQNLNTILEKRRLIRVMEIRPNYGEHNIVFKYEILYIQKQRQ